jgi:2',3'-cyclic-nucleotide 2'-phosphodiesterase (5'-nucleotidase family)
MYEGKRIRGRQMIEAMNAAEMDFAVFGNHEFDITETELQERINESTFQWISSNSFHKKGSNVLPFEKKAKDSTEPIPKTYILHVTDSDGTSVKIGFIGLTLPYNRADYVDYTEPISTAEKLYNNIKDSCDAIVAITHMQISDDIKLAQRIPDLTLILGGHEHDMRFEKTGKVFITKAHANAKSAYIVKLVIDKNKKSAEALPELKMLDETIPFDRTTDSVVNKWTSIANNSYASLGFDPKQVVVASGDSLDGRETEARSKPTNLTNLIVTSMANACPESDVVITNAGSIRLDDILYPPITQYDILRSLPFGGAIREAEIKGSLLVQTLNAGKKNINTGAYLHYYPVQLDPTNNQWTLKGDPIDPEKIYRVAFSEYLVTGKETNLEFLTKDNPAMIKLYDAETSPASSKSDIRLAIVRYLLKLSRKE